MKVSLVLTVFLLAIVAWFVVQSALIVFDAFFKSKSEKAALRKAELQETEQGCLPN